MIAERIASRHLGPIRFPAQIQAYFCGSSACRYWLHRIVQNRALKYVNKSRILEICHVVESVFVQLGLIQSLSQHRLGKFPLVRLGLGRRHDTHILQITRQAKGDTSLSLLLVEVFEVGAHTEYEYAEDGPASHVDVQAGLVDRVFSGKVELRTGNISGALEDKHGRGGDDSFG